ncbi:MAG: hypothetical protein IKP51_11200 [Treponema sp.]|nr:hypothetical protein [Treponema sp.]
MSNKRNPLFTIAITLIYIAAVLYYILSLGIEYYTGDARATNRFTELTREVNRNLNVNQPGTESFTNALLHSLGNMQDIAAVQLQYDGQVFFSYPKDPTKAVSGKSSLVIPNTATLNAKDGAPVLFNIAIYKLRPSSIFFKGRIAFFVILGATIACIIYLIYLYMYSSVYSDDDDDDLNGETYNDLRPLSDDSIEQENFMQEEVKEEEEPAPFFEENPFTGEKANEAYGERDSEQENTEPDLNFFEEKDEEALDPDIANFEYENERAKNDDITLQDTEVTNEQWYKEEDSAEKDLIEEKASEYVQEAPPVEYDVTDVLPDESEDQTVAAGDAVYTDHFEEPELDDVSFDDDFINADLSDLDELEAETKAAAEQKPQPAIRTDVEDLSIKHKAEDNRPHGLFSPVTGFGWEAYMIPRLDSELIRAASDEKDLALLTIKIKDIDWNTPAAKKVADIILQFVKFKDLAFEHKKDGCTAIFQNMNIDTAIKTAEELHTQIITELSKSSMYNQTAIGISSRSLRLISGARLANESEQALEHALEDKESPIIAFKVNPEKYRNYLASEAAKLKGNG